MKPGTLLLSSFLLATNSAAQDTETSTIVVIGDRMIDATGASAKENYAVVIEGDRIVGIGPKDSVRIPRARKSSRRREQPFFLDLRMFTSIPLSISPVRETSKTILFPSFALPRFSDRH